MRRANGPAGGCDACVHEQAHECDEFEPCGGAHLSELEELSDTIRQLDRESLGGYTKGDQLGGA